MENIFVKLLNMSIAAGWMILAVILIGVKTRVKAVLNYRKSASWVIFAAALACIAVAVCFLTNPKQDTYKVRITIPAGSEGGIYYSDEEIFPVKGTEDKNVKYAVIPMIMVNDKYYYDTNQESTKTDRSQDMDGEITSTVDGTKKPVKNNQSNFGSGYGYQFGKNDTIEVRIDGKCLILCRKL